jgi:pilus assembly protein CpaC
MDIWCFFLHRCDGGRLRAGNARARSGARGSPAKTVVCSDNEVVVELNKGRMIKLDRPISSVAISDPLTADVQVVSQRMLFVRGKKVGETTLCVRCCG